jgi:hypothetical protein
LKNKQHIIWALAALLLIGFNACKTNGDDMDVPNYEDGSKYYPLDSGMVRLYLVDSIAFDDNAGTIDTFRFVLEEEIIGNIYGQFQEPHVVIKRSVKKEMSQIWEPRASLFVLRTPNNLQVVEENNRFVKLVFPLGNANTWNGNMFNNLGRRNYLLQFKEQAIITADMAFTDCAQIQEANIKNAIEEVFVRSVYAANVGLVDYTNIYLNTQTSGTSGYAIRQKIIFFYKP